MCNNRFSDHKNKVIWDKTDGRCCYCGEQTIRYYIGKKGKYNNPLRATVEHLKTRASGGTDATNNLIICCNRCNGLRGQLKIKTFRKKFKTEFERDFYYSGI